MKNDSGTSIVWPLALAGFGVAALSTAIILVPSMVKWPHLNRIVGHKNKLVTKFFLNVFSDTTLTGRIKVFFMINHMPTICQNSSGLC